MNYLLLTGLVGSLILVAGAAWPENKTDSNPRKSTKNWLFFVGNVLMFLFAVLGYLAGGPVFFVFLEVLVMIANVLMMLNTDDRIDTAILVTTSAAFIVWSLYLFESFATLFFILGLTGVGLGYAFKMGTLRRNIALGLGSILLVVFSYIEASWVFFWLNLFFAIFSGYYVIKGIVWRRD